MLCRYLPADAACKRKTNIVTRWYPLIIIRGVLAMQFDAVRCSLVCALRLVSNLLKTSSPKYDYCIPNAGFVPPFQLMELISSALRDLAEAEFVGRRDLQNNPLPSPFELVDRQLGSAGLRFNPLQPSGKMGGMPLTPALRDWTKRNVLSAGSLLGKSCQGALLLAGHGEQLQKQGFLFGKHLSLAWQVYINHLWRTRPILEIIMWSRGRARSFNIIISSPYRVSNNLHSAVRV